MALGFGSLKQMSDSFRYNRDLLGKRKSAREMYKEEIKKRGTTEEAQNLEFVRERVAHALRRNRSLELLARIAAALIFFCILAGGIWAAVNIDFTLPKKKKYADKSDLFNTIIYDQSGDLKLRTDYFHSGPKASETYLKDGFKHQNSESYYESGEQFRAALYYYDTLVTDVYFFKSGDTIKNFPAVADTNVHRIGLFDKVRRRKIEFDFYDGKIIQGTYKEKVAAP